MEPRERTLPFLLGLREIHRTRGAPSDLSCALSSGKTTLNQCLGRAINVTAIEDLASWWTYL